MLIEEAREQAITREVLHGYTVAVVHLSEAYLRASRIDQAAEVARQAVQRAHDSQERGNEAYAFRLLGNLAAHREPPEVEPAETHYRQALALAEALSMGALQAHCHRGLCPLYRQTS